MINPIETSKTVIPITPTERHTALTFAQQQPTREKAQQVYRNTLAVLTVKHCFDILEIPTAIAEGDSWNAFSRLGADLADLQVANLGRLECRPVEPGVPSCYVPSETLEDRIGYVVVQIEPAYDEAAILGFVPEVSDTHLEIAQLQPLPNLFIHLETLETQAENQSEPELALAGSRPIVQLRSWLTTATTTLSTLPHSLPTADQLWHSVDALLGNSTETAFAMRSLKPGSGLSSSLFRDAIMNLPRAVLRGIHLDTPEKIQRLIDQLYATERNLSEQPGGTLSSVDYKTALTEFIQTTTDEELRWKAAEALWNIDPGNPATGMRRVMDLGMHLGGEAIALMVAVLRTDDHTLSVLIRAYPMVAGYLPPGFQLTVLAENSEPLLATQARERDNYIELKLNGTFGEQFSVQVTLKEDQLTEYFAI
jgi:Protein of unknown function (DUF1822)